MSRPARIGLLAAAFTGTFTPAATAVLDIVPRERSGIASATVNAARQVGIAVLGTLVSDATTPSAFTDGMGAAMLVAGLAAAVLTVMSTPAVHRSAVRHG